MDRRQFLASSLCVLAGAGMSRRRPAPPAENDSYFTRIADLVHASRQSRGRAVVLGAGIAGLAAARVLAGKGWEVDVFESRAAYGGFCSTLVLDGFTFDLGPHVFNWKVVEYAALHAEDLDPLTITEAFMYHGKPLNFPLDPLFHGFLLDAATTLLKNSFRDLNLNTMDFQKLADTVYGETITRDIFKPLVEKWCASPIGALDGRYMSARLQGKLDPATAAGIVKTYVYQGMDQLYGMLGWKSSEAEMMLPGLPKAQAYAGKRGAIIVPERLAQGAPDMRIHCSSPVTALGLDGNRIQWVEAGGKTVNPDFVVNTIPLNRLAALLPEENPLAVLRKLTYLHIVLVFVRLARPSLLNTKWVWLTDPSVPFYRISEMKTISERHAPEGCTGICLEIAVREGDPKFLEPDKHWQEMAWNFLDRFFSVRKAELIGINVEKREYAYPLFTMENTSLVGKCLKKPYSPSESSHDFRDSIQNLSFAGRSGMFVYSFMPQAILSGFEAARRALSYGESSTSRTFPARSSTVKGF